MNLEKILYKYFGYKSFRMGQREIIQDILRKKNVFATLPTGAGKSICYLLPGYVGSGSVVIVSPLLSLMEDQIQQLKSSGEKSVIAINSTQTFKERKLGLKTLNQYRFIYVSPEALQSKDVITALKKIKVDLFVVDEAHCISQWGHEFRTDYLKIKDVISELSHPPCLALTATASKEIEEDIIHLLGISDCIRHLHSIDRPNIAISIEKLETIDDKMNKVLKYVNEMEGPGIIYCSTRNWAESLSEFLRNNGYGKTAYYHAGLLSEERSLIQHQFLADQIDVICATNAFGMGINKSNIRYVIHFHYPARIESYLQEIGRAGRDGLNSIALLLYCDEDINIPRIFLQSELPDELEVDRTLLYLQNKSFFNEYELCETMQISEVKWRFMKYHLDKVGVLSNNKVESFHFSYLKQYFLEMITERLEYKQRKLVELETWLKRKVCKRASYLLIFDEHVVQKMKNCCNICGIDMNDYKKVGSDHKKTEISNWEEELQKIFHIKNEKKLDL